MKIHWHKRADAADMNKDGKITIVDAVTLVMRLQTGGSE